MRWQGTNRYYIKCSKGSLTDQNVAGTQMLDKSFGMTLRKRQLEWFSEISMNTPSKSRHKSMNHKKAWSNS